jgi:predicted transposase YbfD/YdcC
MEPVLPHSPVAESLPVTLAESLSVVELVAESLSAPVADPRSALEHLVDRFRDFPDVRIDNRNKDHLLVDILISAICAVLGGANSWLAVERFGHAHETWLRTFLELPNGIPSHDTYRRVFLILNAEELNRRFAIWMKDIHAHLELKHVALDGKTMCGSGGGRTGLTALHMVSAFATANGICLAQQAVDSKSNEITAIPELLKLLDLKGALVTIDAMGCQKEIAADIVNAGADYVLTVKENQERLHEDLQKTLAPILQGNSTPETTTTDRLQSDRTPETTTADPLQEDSTPVTTTCAQTAGRNRGRSEKRTCYITTDLSQIRDKLLWKGLKAIGVTVSERECNGKIEVETRYYISSRVLSAQEMLKGVRDHWKIENQLHWVLDVVFGEDAHQLRVGNGPKNFTTLRKLAHALIKNSNPKHGIKGTRELAGWNTAILEEIIAKSPPPA